LTFGVLPVLYRVIYQSQMSAAPSNRPANTDSEINASKIRVPTATSCRISRERYVREKLPKFLPGDNLPNIAAKVLRELSGVCRSDNLPVWMPPQIPRWKTPAGQLGFCVPRWGKDHQPVTLAALYQFKRVRYLAMMLSRLELRERVLRELN